MKREGLLNLHTCRYTVRVAFGADAARTRTRPPGDGSQVKLRPQIKPSDGPPASTLFGR